ncbi:hypothetical protein GCM10009758_17520 [Microbacterium hatanonis]
MPTAATTPRSMRGFLSGMTGVLVTGLVFATLTFSGVATAQPAAAADDDSQAVTISAASYDKDAKNAPFPDLKLTVSQTTGLVSQGIQIRWTGGKESTRPSGQTGGENFLQFAQCWGDDPTDPSKPDRTTCQYGAFLSAGAMRDGNRASAPSDEDDESAAQGPVIAAEDLPYSTPDNGQLDPAYTSIPFRSATTSSSGVHDMVQNVVDNKRVPGVDVNTNQFFTKYTSNEIPWAGSGANGEGSTKFEVQTAAQAQGLGCGSRVTSASGVVTGSSCWLVAIPRGTKDTGEESINQSGLFWDSWKHHVAVKLDFRPIGINCAIGAKERQLVGSELLATAVASWQPSLCGAEGGDVFNMIKSNESDAVAQANAATDTSPLALTSLPYSGESQDDLVYAPVGLSAVTVAFAIDRFPNPNDGVPDAVKERSGLPFESMNLTPRLIAKLLTSSYLDSLPTDAKKDHIAGNPRNIVFDPDFLAINDKEWGYQVNAGVAISDMLVPQGRSDVATQLWRYVLADEDARAFLAGTPDPWGAKVNPYSSTDAKVNPVGAGLSLPRDNFPKADPTQVDAQPNGGAAEINLITWRPFTNDLDVSAYLTLRGDGQVLGPWNLDARPPRYDRVARDLQGFQSVVALTDSSAAAKYQVVTAALRNPAGQFVTADAESMTAAAGAMTASAEQPQVMGLDASSELAKTTAGAYPLTMPVYAAASPFLTDAATRASYASFIRFAATTGQEPGVQVGQLPAGYAPIPAKWASQAVAAANVLQQGLTRTVPTTGDDGPSTAGSIANGTPNGPVSAVAPAAVAPPAAAAPAAGGTGNPTASGAVAGALAGAETSADPDSGALAATLPLSMLAGLMSAAAVLIIPRLPRRP